MHEREEDRAPDKQAAERKGAAESREEDATAGERDPHHALNQPAREPSADEWPDPYERRPDPRAPYERDHEPPAPASGAVSTSEPHPREDPEANPAEAPKRDKLDR